MKVRELREALQGLPDDVEVLLSCDEEGNCFSKLYDVDGENSVFVDVDGEIEIGLEYLTKDLEAQGFGEEDVIDGVACVVLWPC